MARQDPKKDVVISFAKDLVLLVRGWIARAAQAAP